MQQSVGYYRAAAFEEIPSGSYMTHGRVAPLPKQANDPVIRAEVYARVAALAG